MLISSIFDYIYKIIIKQILKKSIICPIFSILIKIMLISSIFDYIYKIIIKQILKKSIICPIFSILIWKDMYN